MLAFVGYLTLRSRASFNILRAAYPNERIEWLKIWGAYFAGYGFNSVIPARGGDVVRLFLTKNAVPNSSYPAVAATFAVELIFDLMMGVAHPDASRSRRASSRSRRTSPTCPAFDLAFFAQHPRFTLFLLTFAGGRRRSSRSRCCRCA